MSVTLTEQGALCMLTLSGGGSKHTLDDELAEALDAALTTAFDESLCPIVVLTATGRTFSGGPDLAGLLDLACDPNGLTKLDAIISRYNSIIMRLYSSPKLTIAALNGPAFGGGFTLTLACDFRLAVARATFLENFFAMGLTPDLGASFFLPRLMGAAAAEALIWSGRMLDAPEACRLGLLHEVAPTREALLERVVKLADELARGPALLVRETRMLLRAAEGDALAAQLAREKTAMLTAFARRTSSSHVSNGSLGFPPVYEAEPTPDLRVVGGGIVAFLALAEIEAEAAFPSIAADERASVARFTNARRRREWIGGRLCAKHAALHGREHDALRRRAVAIAYARNGSPRLTDGLAWTRNSGVSISHSQRFAAAATPPSGAVGIGVDIEEIAPRFAPLAPRFLHASEENALRNAGTEPGTLTQLWTYKEAAAKALGGGIALDLRDFRVAFRGPAGVSLSLAPRLLRRYGSLTPRVYTLDFDAHTVGAVVYLYPTGAT